MKKVKFSLFGINRCNSAAGNSCRKDVGRNLSEAGSLVYITRRDSTINFANYQTFRIAGFRGAGSIQKI